MALIKCAECEKEYSDRAKACPNCGCPTINNTISERRNNIQECSVAINGRETLIPKTSWISIFKIIVPMFTLWALAMSDSLPNFLVSDSEAMRFITFLAIPWIAILLASPLSRLFPEYKERKKRVNVINEYFKKRFVLLESMPDSSSEMQIVNTQARTNEEAMFNLYMQAYNFNADAIVINDSNVTTHVSGSIKSNIIGGGVSGSTSSTNIFHITATLVKY